MEISEIKESICKKQEFLNEEYKAGTKQTSEICRKVCFVMIATTWLYFKDSIDVTQKEIYVELLVYFVSYIFVDILQYIYNFISIFIIKKCCEGGSGKSINELLNRRENISFSIMVIKLIILVYAIGMFAIRVFSLEMS